MKLRMHPGAETVTHGTQGWTVNNGSWIVEVPDEVGNYMLADGRSGCVLVEDRPGSTVCPCCGYAWFPEGAKRPDPPESFVHVRHVSDPKASIGWGTQVFTPDKDGTLHVPAASLAHIEPHGFLPC